MVFERPLFQWRKRRLVRPRYGQCFRFFRLGRLDSRAMSRHHIQEHYLAKSERCKDCIVNHKCDGLHVNMIRHQGLKIIDPLMESQSSDDASWGKKAEKQLQLLRPNHNRIAHGMPCQKTAQSLAGFSDVNVPIEDPLAILAREREDRKKQRQELRRKNNPKE